MTGKRDTAEALLLDLDGVVRVFDPSVAAAAERQHGLPAGAIVAAAFRWERLRPAILGEYTHHEWMSLVTADLTELAGGTDAAGHHDAASAAVAQWRAYRGEIVPAVLDFVRAARAGGIAVGLATNATSLLDQDLEQLGIANEFDAVVNSSKVGAHKPAPEFFTAACRAVGRPPARVLFVDDEDRNVLGARAAGLSAYRWSGPMDLPYLTAALGR